MYKKYLKHRLLAIVSILSLLASAFIPSMSNAAQITSRKVTLGSSAASASTTHAYSFTLPTSGTLGSIKFQYCTTASGSCTTPTGLTTTSATLDAQTGQTGFSMVNTTNGSPYITRSAASGSGAVTYTLGSITNPSTTNSTFFVRITSYTGTDGSTGSVDSGVVASSTSTSISLTASVNEALTFCTGTSGITSSSCAGATGSSVDLGTLTTTSTGTGTSQFGITTNAGSGYVVTYNGATLTSGANTISAIGGSATASTQGSEQFGVNLKANTTPSVGSEVAGAGSAVAAAPYSTADSFAFVAGSAQTMVNQASSDAFRLFTVSYIANIAASTEPGTYTTTLNYVATPTF